MRYLLIVLLLMVCSVQAKTTQWQMLQPGLDYTSLSLANENSNGVLHAFKVNLQDYQLDLVFAQDHQAATASVSSLAKKSDALLAINGGFFTPQSQPLGLRIKNAKVRNPLKPTSWWGVFYVEDNQAHVASQKQYAQHRKQVNFAVQAGPRLVVDGRIPKLKAGNAERSAVCVLPNNNVILVATQNAYISTTDLAIILKRSQAQGGLGCRNALNLDGGHSTQLYAQVGGFKLNVANLSLVTDAIIVKAK